MFQHYGKITGCETIKGMSVFLPSSSLSTIQALPYELNAVYTSIHCPHSSYHLINGLLYCFPPPLWRRQLLKFWYLEKFLWQATAGTWAFVFAALLLGLERSRAALGVSGGGWWQPPAGEVLLIQALGLPRRFADPGTGGFFGSSRARINFCRQSL